MQKLLGDDPDPFSDEVHTSHSLQSESEIENEEQRLAMDDDQFENLRQRLIDDVF